MGEAVEETTIKSAQFTVQFRETPAVVFSLVHPLDQRGNGPVVEEGGAAFIQLEAGGTHIGRLADLLAVVHHDGTPGEAEKDSGNRATDEGPVSAPVFG